MFRKTLLATSCGLLFSTSAAFAQDITVKIDNLSNGLYFTPLLVAAHGDNGYLFRTGLTASANLQAMAEGGDISGLEADVTAISGDYIANPAGGLLAPGGSTTTAVISTDHDYLSLVGMLLPTNDGFVGLDSLMIPETAGTYVVYVNGYDAGTEANDELINSDTGGMPGMAGIPAAPGGDAGTGGTGVTTTELNDKVHIHRGNLGDTDEAGGSSDLNATIHRWLNPVAKVTITVQ